MIGRIIDNMPLTRHIFDSGPAFMGKSRCLPPVEITPVDELDIINAIENRLLSLKGYSSVELFRYVVGFEHDPMLPLKVDIALQQLLIERKIKVVMYNKIRYYF